MRLAIFGSRTLCDERVENAIQEKIDLLKPDCIVTSGETSGVNEIARDKARENKITLVLEYANGKKYAKGKYEHRSIAIMKNADMVLFIHDGESIGTANELKICKKMKLPFDYVKIERNDAEDIEWADWDVPK